MKPTNERVATGWLCITSHRIASHRITSHRIASHRITLHCIALNRALSPSVGKNLPLPTQPPLLFSGRFLHACTSSNYGKRIRGRQKNYRYDWWERVERTAKSLFGRSSRVRTACRRLVVRHPPEPPFRGSSACYRPFTRRSKTSPQTGCFSVRSFRGTIFQRRWQLPASFRSVLDSVA